MAERGAAFFDLDRTLIVGASAYHFGRAARRAGLITRTQLLKDGVANIRFRLRGVTDADAAELRERIAASLAGIRVSKVRRLSSDVLGHVLPLLYPQMLEIAYGHQDAGRRVYICTAASQDLAETLATVLGFDGAVGTVFDDTDGIYTGQLDGPFVYRDGKAQATRALAEREGIDLAASYAYSDSESDLPFLELVGNPVAVNPDAILRSTALERGWEILHLEKLGRRLKVAAAIGVAGCFGGVGGIAVAKRQQIERVMQRFGLLEVPPQPWYADVPLLRRLAKASGN